MEKMSLSDIQEKLTEEDAFHIIVDYLRTGVRSNYAKYGYELYLPHVMVHYLTNTISIDSQSAYGLIKPISHIFYNAAWEMCRRGILRPGISKYGSQATEDGASGNGYSVTALGKEWLEQSSSSSTVKCHFRRLMRPNYLK